MPISLSSAPPGSLTLPTCLWFALLVLGFLAPGLAVAQRPLGTDVSGYQPSINWTTVKNAGVAFAWSKATEGTGYVNPYFTTQEAGAKGVGIYIGAYHFARPSYHTNITGANSADSEAAYFWATVSNYVKYGGAYLVPMLDWEDTGVTNQLPATTMSAWVNEWCTSVSNYARLAGIPGVRPVVYTGTWYSRPSGTYSGLTTAVTNWPSWIAAYPYCDASSHCGTPNPQVGGPSDTYPWSACNIWQYGNTNWSGGDADVFNGNLSGFVQMFVIGGTNVPAITMNPANVTVAVGSSATFSVRASGQAPLSFQWLFDATIIPGATSSNYTIATVQLTNAGGYAVVVSNSLASVPSSTAFLSVLSQLTNSAGSILAPPGLVDWWPAEGNANDIFGPYNGTPANGFSYTAGKQGLGFHFDGSSSYITTGAPDLVSPWTVCMWVNRQNAPGSSAALMSDGTYSLKLEQYNATRKVGVTQLGVGDYAFNYSAPAGTWVHLAFVGTGSQTLLYANGVLQGATNSVPLPRGYIGANYVTSGSRIVDYMLGSVDEILCFNRALNGPEISAIYAAGSAGLVRAPEFTGMASLSPGNFQLSLRGQTGKNFALYSSIDLVTWSFLTTIPNPTGALQYTDSTATNDLEFYRATQP
ncbi:MAG TPA: GH25 family lysozyme [Candidatus Binatia bacterium]|nr:GH25 family lysozyme [Candidatus Binatia bacterium]